MKASTLVTFLAVAGTPALCKKKPSPPPASTATITSTPTTIEISTEKEWSPQQISAFSAAYQSYILAEAFSPDHISYEMDLREMSATMPYKSFQELKSALQQADTGSMAQAAHSSALDRLPPADRSYLLGFSSSASVFFSSLQDSVLAMATVAPATTTFGGPSAGSTLVQAREAKKPAPRPASTTSITSTVAPSFTTISTSSQEWSPAQSSAYDAALLAWANSKMIDAEYQTHQSDLSRFFSTLPYKSYDQFTSLFFQTETGSIAEAKWSSGVAMLPSADQSYINKLHSEVQESLSKFVDAMTTSTAVKTGSASTKSTSMNGRDVRKTLIPIITPAPQLSNVGLYEKRYLFSAEWPASQKSELDAALSSFAQSLESKYPSIGSRLSTENIDTSSIANLRAQLTLGAPDLDAQISSINALFPAYAQDYEKEGMAGLLSIVSSAANPTNTVNPRSDALQTPSNTIVDIFTDPSMTPEQIDALEEKFENYFRSVYNSPDYTSVFDRLATEQLDEIAIEKLTTQTVSGTSAFDAQMSSVLDLYPTYARSLLSSVEFAELSIWSEVLNAPTTSDVPVTTIALSTTSTGDVASSAAVLPTQSLTSAAPSKKGGKKPKKHGTITSRAVLPRKTPKGKAVMEVSTEDMEYFYPTHSGWNEEQLSAMRQGAASLLSSLIADPQDYSEVIKDMTASEMAFLHSYDGPAATRLFDDPEKVSSVFSRIPPAASSVFNKVYLQEISLLSKVDNMAPRTTLGTKTKSKRAVETSTLDGDENSEDYFDFARDDALYSAELSYDQSMLAEPTFSSILAQMSGYASDDDWKMFVMEMNGPLRPEFLYSPDEYASLTEDYGSMIATMPSDVQAFFSSVASDQASIQSSVLAEFAASATTSGGKQVAVTSASASFTSTSTATVLSSSTMTVTPTGTKSSASTHEVLSSAVLAMALVIIMALL